MQTILIEQPVSEDTVVGIIERNWYGAWRVWEVILQPDGFIRLRERDLGVE